MIEHLLLRIADRVIHLDEASVTSLWDKYRRITEHVEPTREWERAVVVFFLINAIRAKNAILNDYIKEKSKASPSPSSPKASLRLIKGEEKPS